MRIHLAISCIFNSDARQVHAVEVGFVMVALIWVFFSPAHKQPVLVSFFALRVLTK